MRSWWWHKKVQRLSSEVTQNEIQFLSGESNYKQVHFYKAVTQTL